MYPQYMYILLYVIVIWCNMVFQKSIIWCNGMSIDVLSIEVVGYIYPQYMYILLYDVI